MSPVRAALLLLLAAALAACGSMNVVSDGADARLMLRGNDPVGYFTAGRALPGREDLKAVHGGVTYRFASEANRRTFLADPEKYVPQFGGFCANGMAYSVPIAGATDHFAIIDGRLYMFGGRGSKLFFEMDQARNMKLARHYWENEVRDADWRLHSWKRLVFRVPHYRTNAELADEYARRFGRRP